jgi:hypothetical protein
MGVGFRTCTPVVPSLRAGLLAASAAVLALVALPTGAAADHRVPPSPCPPDVTLAGIERAPGGVIFVGTVTAVNPRVGRISLAVEAWYRRGSVPGLEPGVHPANVPVALGRGLVLAGTLIPTAMPQVGSRFFVAGTWLGPPVGASVVDGVFANVNDPAAAPWLAEAEARYAAFAPTPDAPPPAIPIDAPWLAFGAVVAALLLAAAVIETIADARDPLPAT